MQQPGCGVKRKAHEQAQAVDELPQVQELQQQPGKVAERTPSNNDAAVEPPPQKLPRLCITFNPKRKAFVAAAAAMEGGGPPTEQEPQPKRCR